jgi:hypothetical protein
LPMALIIALLTQVSHYNAITFSRFFGKLALRQDINIFGNY